MVRVIILILLSIVVNFNPAFQLSQKQRLKSAATCTTMPSRMLIQSATLVVFVLLLKKYQMLAVLRISVVWKSLVLMEKLVEMETLVDALVIRSAASAAITTHALK